ncbi:MAG: SAM-dependent methyltransferase [Bacteroidales bacterium]|nr:SAM-dependent methyltransferase [Bacteroidales bacterium]
MKESWNSRYTTEEFIYGVKPNDFFKSFIENNPPGKILLPGDGEGRNAVYAAIHGWDVTAYDYSDSAKNKALSFAIENNVQINYLNSTVETFSSKDKFDLISIIYLHLPPIIRHTFHAGLSKYLNPNGKILMECFSKLQFANKSGGPKNMDLLYSLKDIQNDFKNHNIELLEQKEINLNESSLHQGKASVIRLIASKSTS